MTRQQYYFFILIAMVLEFAHQNFGLCFLIAAGLDVYIQANKRGAK